MFQEDLDAVRVTADRVRRFSADVEDDPSGETRMRWRAALADLRDAIRRARASGRTTAEIQDATGDASPRRFVRAPLTGDGEAAAPEELTT